MITLPRALAVNCKLAFWAVYLFFLTNMIMMEASQAGPRGENQKSEIWTSEIWDAVGLSFKTSCTTFDLTLSLFTLCKLRWAIFLGNGMSLDDEDVKPHDQILCPWKKIKLFPTNLLLANQ